MAFFCRVILALFLTLALFGCEQRPTTLNDLLKRPLLVKEKAATCRASLTKTAEQEAQCLLVMEAATKIMAIIVEQQTDPEKFGEGILQNETQCSELIQKITATKRSLSANPK